MFAGRRKFDRGIEGRTAVLSYPSLCSRTKLVSGDRRNEFTVSDRKNRRIRVPIKEKNTDRTECRLSDFELHPR